MSAVTAHRLVGLEPDNLLAFMALLGLLRALEKSKPDWRPRVYWDETCYPLRSVLTLAQERTQQDVAAAAADGVNALTRAHRFDRENITYAREEAERLLKGNVELERVVFEALMSDGAIKENEDKVWPTPLCFLFGQGWQHFLSRLTDVPQGRLPKKLQKLKQPPDLRSPSYVESALFASWRRQDPTEGFRWDPAEDRRYALRGDDPSGDPAGTQHGANRLAATALPLFSTAVVERRHQTRLLTRSASYTLEGAIRFTWPLWSRPATLATVSALLAHPALAQDEPYAAAAPAGVFGFMRAERISVGKFFNVTAAQRLD